MMTDSAVKTPKKRKSGEGLPPSGKKQKLNGVQQKPKTPQATPNKDGQKKLGKFAGTAALKNFNQQKQKSPKNKNADGAEANNKEKIAKKNRKRNSAFKSLTGIINEGNDSAKKDAIAKIEDKIKAIENRDEKSKSAQRKLKFLKRLKNRAEGKAPAPVQQNAEKTNKTKARRDRKNKLKKLGEGEQNIQEKQGQKKGGKAVKQQVVQKTEEESSEESDEQEAVASPPKAQKGKAKQKPQQKKNVPQAQDESDDGEEDESDAEGEEESGEEEESGSEVEGEEDENDDEEEGDAEEGSDDEESEEEPAPKPIQKNQIVKTENKTKNKGDVVQNVKLEDLEKNNLVSKGQKRYILFIGNIPYDTTKQDLVEHFKKAGDIVHVRIPTEKGSKKPRGFAYLEVKDNIVYEKCLSMHHSFLKGRRLNVLYTQSGKKKSDGRKSEVKKKNMKLQALRKQGKLVGSVKESQKRSFRRNKKKNASTVQREQDE